jgi:uncharacterized membrane protein YedE/YeeE
MSLPLLAIDLTSATPFWPFWLGGLALATASVGTLVLLRRPLGISGNLSRVLDRDELRRELRPKAERSTAELEAELMAATLAAFGAMTPDMPLDDVSSGSSTDPTVGKSTHEVPTGKSLGPALSWSVSLLFLLGIIGGGALAAAVMGRAPTLSAGATYAALFGDGALAWLALFGGGVLVGLGTQLSGGCTTGHGLVGCGIMRPGSLVATACFFGTGIVVSLLLSAVLT